MELDPFAIMLLVTSVAGLSTGLGAVPTLLGTRVSHRVYDAALGLAAGIMVAASVFGLVTVAEGVFPVAAGVAAGAMLGVVFRKMIPSSHAHGYADAATGAFLHVVRAAGRRRRGGGGLTAGVRPGKTPDRPRQTRVIGAAPPANSTFTLLSTGFYVPGELSRSE